MGTEPNRYMFLQNGKLYEMFSLFLQFLPTFFIYLHCNDNIPNIEKTVIIVRPAVLFTIIGDSVAKIIGHLKSIGALFKVCPSQSGGICNPLWCCTCFITELHVLVKMSFS